MTANAWRRFRRTVAVPMLMIGVCARIGQTQQPAAAVGSPVEFVQIEPGEFRMGCSEGDNLCLPNEKPLHRVTITKRFEIGKYEVTQAQWRAVMGMVPSRFTGDNRPVENVTHANVTEFLSRMNARNDGYRYRLPTEAEWEYAARAGTAPYAGALDAMAWYSRNAESQTHPVGQRQPNAWGLYDMQGNVSELVQDSSFRTYTNGSPTDPATPTDPGSRLYRGGSWQFDAQAARVSFRTAGNVGNRTDIGLRLLRESVDQANGEESITRGMQKVAAGDAAGALTEFNRAIELNPRRDAAWTYRALSRIALGDNAGGLAEINHVIEQLQTRYYVPYLLRASDTFRKTQYQAALADYNRAIDLGPDAPLLGRVYGERSQVRQRLGDLDGAKADLILAMERGAQLTPPPFSRFPILQSLGSPQEGADYVNRPIWHIDTIQGPSGQPSLASSAVFADGRQAGTLGNTNSNVSATVWAPNGRLYAFLTRTATGDAAVFHQLRGNETFLPLRNVDQMVFWEIAWSPNSARAAFVFASEPRAATQRTFMLAIYEVAARQVVLHQIPARTLANYPVFTETPDGLRWSPDGRKILVSWGNVIAVDAQTGTVQVISDIPAPAEWTPESDAVLYLAYQGECCNRVLTGLFIRKLGETQPALLADAARLASFGFIGRGLNYGLLRLSPSGSKLAIGGGIGTVNPSPSSTLLSTLLVFETRPGGLQLDRPVARFQMGITAALDWAPDEKSLAALTLSETPIVPQTAPDQPSGTQVFVRIQPLGTGDARTASTIQLPAGTAGLDILTLRALSWSR